MNVNENILNSLFNEFCKEKNKITNCLTHDFLTNGFIK